MLSSWNIEYIPVNVHGNDEARSEMESYGISTLPAAIFNRRSVSGWNPKALADLVGVAYNDRPVLKPHDLFMVLDRILRLTQEIIAPVAEEKLDVKKPSRDRTLRHLCYHVFRLSNTFVDAVEKNRLLHEWLVAPPPADIRTGRDLEGYGQKVRDRISDWKKSVSAEIFNGAVNTYYGDQGVHHLLERTVWHAGQHLRQIRDLLIENGIEPSIALDDSIFEGLPMPDDVW